MARDDVMRRKDAADLDRGEVKIDVERRHLCPKP